MYQILTSFKNKRNIELIKIFQIFSNYIDSNLYKCWIFSKRNGEMKEWKFVIF